MRFKSPNRSWRDNKRISYSILVWDSRYTELFDWRELIEFETIETKQDASTSTDEATTDTGNRQTQNLETKHHEFNNIGQNNFAFTFI